MRWIGERAYLDGGWMGAHASARDVSRLLAVSVVAAHRQYELQARQAGHASNSQNCSYPSAALSGAGGDGKCISMRAPPAGILEAAIAPPCC